MKILSDKEQQNILNFWRRIFFYYFLFKYLKLLINQHKGKLWKKQFKNKLSRIFILIKFILMYLLRIGICFKLQSFPWNRIGRFYEATDSVRLRTQALTDELSSRRGYGFWITMLHDFLKMRKYDFSHTLFFHLSCIKFAPTGS